MFHVKHQGWILDAERFGVRLTQVQLGALDSYRSLLEAVAVPRGMVATRDRDRLWERHILDGLRGVGEIPARSSVVDVGSGAGIPGVPLAVALPSARFVLIEPRRARVAFLEAVVDDLGLANVEVVLGKASSVRDTFDVAVARALAPPAESWAIAEPLLEPGGRLVYWAGKGFRTAEVVDIGASCRLSTRSGLADEGPLVIMARR
jgi:16S rRNA (guanine527-N7)-methyltransferase